MDPPYRLYVIVDRKNDEFYVVEWEHKNKQQKVINNLTKKLHTGISYSLDQIFD